MATTISELAREKAQSFKPSSTASQEALPASINTLFARFAIVYQSKWTFTDSRIRDKLLQEWGRVLKGINDVVIMRAVDSWIEKYNWPPSGPSEFKAEVKNVQDEIQRQNEMQRARNSLPPPPTDVEVCFAKTLSAIKRIKHDNPELSWVEVGKIYQEQKRNAHTQRPV